MQSNIFSYTFSYSKRLSLISSYYTTRIHICQCYRFLSLYPFIVPLYQQSPLISLYIISVLVRLTLVIAPHDITTAVTTLPCSSNVASPRLYVYRRCPLQSLPRSQLTQYSVTDQPSHETSHFFLLVPFHSGKRSPSSYILSFIL